MLTLFDIIEEKKKEDNGNLIENKTGNFIQTQPKTVEGVPRGYEIYFKTEVEYLAYLEHLKQVKTTLYNEEDIRKSGLSRSDYIRLNSYVGSRMNTDFRGISKHYNRITQTTEKEETMNNNFEIIEVDDFDTIDNIPFINNKEDLFVIVDGSSLLTTSFFASLPMSYKFAKTDEAKAAAEKDIMNVNGLCINGVFTAATTLLNDILKNTSATHLAVTLDLTRDSFRRGIYEEYKGTRKETNPLLKSQYPIFKEFLENIGIKVFESKFDDQEIYEADDFTGSLVEKFSNSIPVAIYTKDEDHFQLLRAGVCMWAKSDFNKIEDLKNQCTLNGAPFNTVGLPNACFEFTADNLLATRNLTPDIVVDAKAIGGDTSDNIPGVKGVSKDTANELMLKYKSIENLYAEIDPLVGNTKPLKAFGDYLKAEVISTTKTPVNALIKSKESAFLSKKLAKIKCDIDLDCTLEDLRININTNALINELDKYNMRSLKSRLNL